MIKVEKILNQPGDHIFQQHFINKNLDYLPNYDLCSCLRG